MRAADVCDEMGLPARQPGGGPSPRFVVLVANAKGGCGKTTLSTNLAAYLASQGQSVSLLDLDPLQSAESWLRRRQALGRHDIHSLTLKLDRYTTYGRLSDVVSQARNYLIIDSPGGLDGPMLDHVLRVSQVVLVPVLPSPIDIRAATRFLQAVMLSPCYRRRPRRVAVIANRTRTRTRMYEQLRQFLSSLKIPYLATLRDTQLYMQAAGEGSGIVDMPAQRAAEDVAHWRGIAEWLEVQRHLLRSLPRLHS